MDVSINSSDFEFLIANLTSDAVNLIMKAKNTNKQDRKVPPAAAKIFLSLEEDEIDLILGSLAILLTEKGLSVNSEVNSFGLRIENLIDLFNSRKNY